MHEAARRILYMVHDLDDSSIWRRVEMLEAGGAAVTIAGFRRSDRPLPRQAICLGNTQNGKLGQRLAAVLKALAYTRRTFKNTPAPTVILARNLGMLAVAQKMATYWARPAIPVAYEVLDIHRVMLGRGVHSKLLRWVERKLARTAVVLVTSSPAFIREYFVAFGQLGPSTALCVVENRVNGFDDATVETCPARTAEPNVTVGWFGNLRCLKSLHLLDAITRKQPGRYEILMAGRPALDVLPNFHTIVESNPDLSFYGPYRNPEDLPTLYQRTRFSWVVDQYEAGQNSEWLLPNRLYEGCLSGAIPIVLSGTETARHVESLDIGLQLPDLKPETLLATLAMPEVEVARLRADVEKIPRNQWITSRSDCRDLVSALCSMGGGSVRQTPAAPQNVESLT